MIDRAALLRLSPSQRDILVRALRYGETRTVTGNERASVAGPLTRGGWVTTEPIGERTLLVRLAPGVPEVVKSWLDAPAANPGGSKSMWGGRRHFVHGSGNGGGA